MSTPGSTMAAEMAEQPERLAALVSRRDEILAAVAPTFAPPLAGTVVVARGSSDHAATTGRYLLEMATRRPVASASPSISTLYRTDVDYEGYALIAVSQSGRTPEIATVLERARSRGARTVAITNDPASRLGRAAEAVLDLGAGAEKAVPATKTVTTELVAFALLAASCGLDPGEEAFSALPEQAKEVLDDPEPMEEIARWLEDADRLATVARGPLYGAAAETALKLQETCGLLATAFSSADLRHGPIALASSGIRALLLAHRGPAAGDVVGLAAEMGARGAQVRLVGTVESAACGWSEEAPECLAPVLAVIRGQQLARARALLAGLDPDSPEGLSKVTLT